MAFHRNALQFCRDNFSDLAKAGFVFGVETIPFRAVDIEHAEQMRVVARERHDDLRFRSGVAGNVPGKLVHVGHPYRHAFFSGGSDYTAAKGDSNASDPTLKRAEDKLA